MRFVHNDEVYELKFIHCIDNSKHVDLQELSTVDIVEHEPEWAITDAYAKRARGVTQCLLKRNDVPVKALGVAICGGSDQYNKELGRQIAMARLQDLLLRNNLADYKVVSKVGMSYFFRDGSKAPQVYGVEGQHQPGDILPDDVQAEVNDLWSTTDGGRQKLRKYHNL